MQDVGVTCIEDRPGRWQIPNVERRKSDQVSLRATRRRGITLTHRVKNPRLPTLAPSVKHDGKRRRAIHASAPEVSPGSGPAPDIQPSLTFLQKTAVAVGTGAVVLAGEVVKSAIRTFAEEKKSDARWRHAREATGEMVEHLGPDIAKGAIIGGVECLVGGGHHVAKAIVGGAAHGALEGALSDPAQSVGIVAHHITGARQDAQRIDSIADAAQVLVTIGQVGIASMGAEILGLGGDARPSSHQTSSDQPAHASSASYCGSCGHKHSADVKFCGGCGAPAR